MCLEAGSVARTGGEVAELKVSFYLFLLQRCFKATLQSSLSPCEFCACPSLLPLSSAVWFLNHNLSVWILFFKSTGSFEFLHLFFFLI